MLTRSIPVARAGLRFLTTKQKDMLPKQIYQDNEHPINNLDIKASAWSVIWRLQKQGYEAFLVGGTVRDLLLNRPPKDIDIVTSADLDIVKRLFHKSVIVGKRFPICLVILPTEQIEVSSFVRTMSKHPLPPDLDKSIHRHKSLGRHITGDEETGLPVTWSLVRQLNASTRDFSVNAMMYDPCAQLLFDYVDGFADLKKKRLRCLQEPSLSFQEDPARILRAIRFASRLDFTIDDATGEAMKNHAKLILMLPQARAQLEIGKILTDGSTPQALKLMWKHGVLDWVLPQHAHYLESQEYPRNEKSKKQNALFSVLEIFESLKPNHQSIGLQNALVALAVPLIVQNVQRMRNKFINAQFGEESGKEEQPLNQEIDQIKKSREDVVYKIIVETTLREMSHGTKGLCFFQKGSIKRASEIFQYIKKKQIYESYGEILEESLHENEKLSVSLLESKPLNWKTSSSLGLRAMDPSEPFIHIK